MAVSDIPDITCLLRDAAQGSQAAVDRLMPHVYDELRRRAAACLRRERPGHTLETSALVHEAYLRLIDQRNVDWTDRLHFFAVASTCIRRILVDHARRRQAAKRGSALRVTHSGELGVAGCSPDPAELLQLDRALGKLRQVDERKFRVTELRFFGGLEIREIAAFMAVSEGTVERDLRLAKAWLYRELSGGGMP